MALTAQLRGRLIHIARVPYDFVDRQTNDRVQGTTCLLFVAKSDEERPHAVKFRRDQADTFEALTKTMKFGDPVTFNVVPGPRDNAFQHDFESVEATAGATGSGRAAA